MWPFKKNKKNDAHLDEKWTPIGNGNPFNAPILDIRSIALSMTSTTSDENISNNFLSSRQCDGAKYIDFELESPKSYATNFSYPHNRQELNGVVFKSPSMEVKWDIFAYGEWFYFVRSWTSELIYKVRFENAGNSLIFKEIIASKKPCDIDAQNIHSIMLTHVLNTVWPYHVPEDLVSLPFDKLALHMFSQFGSKATLLTTQNVFHVERVKR